VIEDAIRTYLLTQSPITTLVGTDASGMARIYAQDRQQGVTGDCIVMDRLGSDHLHNLEKAGGTVEAIFEFDCISTTYAGAKALANALRGELQGFRGTISTIAVHWCLLDDDSDDYDPPADGSTKGTYHVIQTYRIQYLESIPTFA